MPVSSIQVTITAAANVQISTVSTPVRQVMFQNNGANPMRVGGRETSATVGAKLLSASVGSLNAGAFSAANTNLSEWFVAGTNGDVVDVVFIP